MCISLCNKLFTLTQTMNGMENFKIKRLVEKRQLSELVTAFHGYVMHGEGTVTRETYMLYFGNTYSCLDSFNNSYPLFFERLRADLGPTLTPIQRVLGITSIGLKPRRRDAAHFTFSEPCIVIYKCKKNQKMHTFFINNLTLWRRNFLSNFSTPCHRVTTQLQLINIIIIIII